MLFQPPPPTSLDLNFSVAGIPVRVHPLFWLIGILLGYSGDLAMLVIWVAAVFVSVLIHELGHALAMRRYGVSSYIVLYWGGGLTVPEPASWGYTQANVSLTPGNEIFISLAGPGMGFLFAGLVMAGVAAAGGTAGFTTLFGIVPMPMASLPAGGRILNLIVATLLWVNIFWGLINLMPVYPLDGGNVARYALLQADPRDGVRKSLWVSVITGAALALAGLLLMHSIFMAFLFGWLAFQSYMSLGRGF